MTIGNIFPKIGCSAQLSGTIEDRPRPVADTDSRPTVSDDIKDRSEDYQMIVIFLGLLPATIVITLSAMVVNAKSGMCDSGEKESMGLHALQALPLFSNSCIGGQGDGCQVYPYT